VSPPALIVREADESASLPRVFERALAATDAEAFVVVDGSRVASADGLIGLADELEPGLSAVAARILDASGERVIFDGGVVDLRLGPVRREEHRPAAVRPAGRTATLWFDPRAFAITRDAAATIVALPVAPSLEALSVGWQIWRAGGSVRMSSMATRSSDADEPVLEEVEIRVALGLLLEPGTISRCGIRLDGVLDTVLTGRSLYRVSRARSDAEILAAVAMDPFGAPATRQAYTVPGADPARRRVTVLCSDSIGPSMAGPGIRAVELARSLSDRFDVSLLARNVTGHVELDGSVAEMDGSRLGMLALGRDPIVLQGPLTDWFPQVLLGTAPIAVDLYDPMNLEALEHPDAATHVPYAVRLLVEQVVRGDFFMCASDRQRDYWLGMLAACGRIDASAYREDPDLRALIDVVPFGLPGDAPTRSGPGPRDEFAAIGASDPLFVWNGGLWDWFDPATLLDATALARQVRPDIRVLFMGVRRPGALAPAPAAVALMRRSDELGLSGVNVFFRGWTPYETRHDTYLESTAAVSLHHAHLESRFSFRTRLLDCIWSTLPIIGTEGDVLAELVREEHLGLTVRPGDVAGVSDALLALAEDRDGVTTRARIELESIAPRFRWKTAAEPLVAWIDRAESRPRHVRPDLPSLASALALPEANEHGGVMPSVRRIGRSVRARLG
jgi:glycosyltransferase involved in cell wall biosynthesis